MASNRDILNQLFEADRAMRRAESQLFHTEDPEELARLFDKEVQEAIAMGATDESELRLLRLADLCAQLDDPRMADSLIAILNDERPHIRVAAGEALLDVAYDRYADVAHGVERALERSNTGLAMMELPWILAEVGEPSALPLIRRFLESPSAEVIGAAVEALASLGDPNAIPFLEPLKNDTRVVTMDEGEEEIAIPLGQLVREAIQELKLLN
jgi:HEAT repeat protein